MDATAAGTPRPPTVAPPAFIAAEKLLPWPTGARLAVALSLLALGLGVAFFPADVPGFAEPEPACKGAAAMASPCRPWAELPGLQASHQGPAMSLPAGAGLTDRND